MVKRNKSEQEGAYLLMLISFGNQKPVPVDYTQDSMTPVELMASAIKYLVPKHVSYEDALAGVEKLDEKKYRQKENLRQAILLLKE